MSHAAEPGREIRADDAAGPPLELALRTILRLPPHDVAAVVAAVVAGRRRRPRPQTGPVLDLGAEPVEENGPARQDRRAVPDAAR